MNCRKQISRDCPQARHDADDRARLRDVDPKLDRRVGAGIAAVVCRDPPTRAGRDVAGALR
jgi:hypothetical protein